MLSSDGDGLGKSSVSLVAARSLKLTILTKTHTHEQVVHAYVSLEFNRGHQHFIRNVEAQFDFSKIKDIEIVSAQLRVMRTPCSISLSLSYLLV